MYTLKVFVSIFPPTQKYFKQLNHHNAVQSKHLCAVPFYYKTIY